MNKHDVIRAVASKANFTIDDTKSILQTFMDVMIETLENNEEFCFWPYFKLYTKAVGERPAYNAYDRKHLITKPRRHVVFKKGIRLREVGATDE